MPFTGTAQQYDAFMGRYAPTLAVALADYADVRSGMRVVDVGCGPGGLTGELAARVGSANVAAIDPTPPFAAACRERNPGADVREGVAEALPWESASFDVSLSCLVVGFMTDPQAGVREMARVVRPGGTVAACMWDLGGHGMTMLEVFWRAVRSAEPNARGEGHMAGSADGDLTGLLERAGLEQVTGGALMASADYRDFDDFWQPFTYAIGPAGQYLASLPAHRQEQIRAACREALPEGPFSLKARAWCARGGVPS